jgi:hypothetical protein
LLWESSLVDASHVKKLKPDTSRLMQLLSDHFYEVVPTSYATFCAFSAYISKGVLEHFGLACELQPCQIWYCHPDHTYVIGFLGRPAAGKWDGHVVCRSGPWLIDGAMQHFAKEFGLRVPRVVVAPCFEFPSQALARWRASDTDTVWWHHPPVGSKVELPQEPQDMIDGYVAQLVEKIRQVLS